MVSARRSAIPVALLAAITACVAACSTQPTPPPTTSPTLTPTSAPSATATPVPTSTAAASPAATGSAAGPLSITTKPFAKVAGSPLTIAAPNDGTGRLFVGNQAGQIWVVNLDGSVVQQAMIDLSTRIRSGGEQGLLGLALHPRFPADPRVFVDFTDTRGDTVIASLEVDPGNDNRLDAASFTQILVIDQPYANHNGGSLQFGPDGYLTIAMGDGGSGGDPMGNGQDPTTLLGKILRIDIDASSGGQAYGIPAGNPLAKGGGAPEIWITGLRNPWRTSFDRNSGDFWMGDVGQGRYEEIDVVRADSSGLINFGWNVTEGFHCYQATTCDQAGLTPPVAEYGHDLGCAVVGGYVYRGNAFPFLDGTYLFSDNCTSTIWTIDSASNGPSVPTEVGAVTGNLSTFGEDAAGELYTLTLEGDVLKVTAAQR